VLTKGDIAAPVFLLLFIGLSFSKYAAEGGWVLLLFFISLGIAFRGNAKLKGFSFTTMIFGVVSAFHSLPAPQFRVSLYDPNERQKNASYYYAFRYFIQFSERLAAGHLVCKICPLYQ
jgi:hypothetical protein